MQSFEESSCFNQLEREWLALLQNSPMNSIFLTPHCLESWWTVIGHKRGELALFTVRDSRGELVAIAPFFICQEKEGKVMRLLGEPDLCDYGDLIIRSGYEEEVLPLILSALRKLEFWDRLEIHGMPADSGTFAVLQNLAESHSLKLEQEFQDNCPYIILPSSWEEYLEELKPKDRHELRRKLRRWEKQDGSSWYVANFRNSLLTNLKSFLCLLRKSKKEKERFADESRVEFFLLLGQRLFQEGWLYLPFLEVNGERIASLFCIDYNNAIQVYNSGFNPEFSYLSPGVICMALSLKDAISKSKICLDFLRGEEPYKYRFGAKDRPILSVTIYR